jgi:hypothetical protein
VALMAEFYAFGEYLRQAGQLYRMISTGTWTETRDAGWQLVVVFLFTVLTAVVLLAAGFLLGVFWLRDEHARLIVLREEVGHRTAMLEQLAHREGAAATSRGAVPATSSSHQAD